MTLDIDTGRWTAKAFVRANNGHRYWLCVCQCGSQREVREDHLRTGMSRSCGCLMREITARRSVTHGLAPRGRATPEYSVWCDMRRRCEKPYRHEYRLYGGRGIRVCERWQKFENFYADMGPRPSQQYSLDRINNDGNYEPGNCRWATKAVQGQNTGRTKLTAAIAERIRSMVAAGLTKIEVSRLLNVKYGSVKAVAAGDQWRKA